MQWGTSRRRSHWIAAIGMALACILLLAGCEVFRGFVGVDHYQQMGPAGRSEILRQVHTEPRKGRSGREIFGDVLQEKLSGLTAAEAVALLEADNFACARNVCVYNSVTRSDIHPIQPELDGTIFVGSWIVMINSEKLERADDLDYVIISSDHGKD